MLDLLGIDISVAGVLVIMREEILLVTQSLRCVRYVVIRGINDPAGCVSHPAGARDPLP